MTTTARRKALRWFAAHEKDQASLVLGPPPSKRMRTLMIKENQLQFERVVGGKRFFLTDAGRQIIEPRYGFDANATPLYFGPKKT